MSNRNFLPINYLKPFGSTQWHSIWKRNQWILLGILFFLSILLSSIIYNVTISGVNNSPEVLCLDSPATTYKLCNYIEILEDPSSKLTIDAVSSSAYQGHFVPIGKNYKNLGYSNATFWARLTLKQVEMFHKTHSDFNGWVLKSRWRFLRTFDLFYPEKDGIAAPSSWKLFRAGEQWTWKNKGISGLPIVIELPEISRSPMTVYLKADSWGLMVLDLEIQHRQTFNLDKGRMRNVQFIYIGLMGVLLIYNFFIWLALRDTSQLYYLLSILFMSSGIFRMVGPSIPYLSWVSPELDDRLIQASVSASVLFFIRFSQVYLDLRQKFPKIDTGLNYFSAAYIIFIPICFLIPFQTVEMINTPLAFTAIVLILVSSYFVWTKGYRPARYFFFAFLTLVMCWIIYSASYYSIIPLPPTDALLLIQAGSILEAILLSIALADGVRVLHEEKESIKERMQVLYDTIKDIVFRLDLNGELLSVNPAGSALGINPPDKLLGKPFTQLMSEEYRRLFHEEVIPELKKNGRHHGLMEFTSETSETPRQYLEFRAILTKENNGKKIISGIGSLATDRITAEKELRKTQNQLIQIQKLEAIGTLAGGISHDFNNLLQSVIGPLSLLRMDKRLTARHQHYFEIIHDSAMRGVALVKQLMAFSRKVDPHFEITPLAFIVNETVELLKKVLPKTIKIDVKHLQPSPKILGDHQQIQQALLNLAFNARDAMPEGGQLKIDTLRVSPGTNWVYPDITPAEYCVVRMGDTGAGMTPEVRQKIFDPFFSTKKEQEGGGMGLPIAHRIISSHNGRIHCESIQGQGTRFSLFFPAQKTEHHHPVETGIQSVVGSNEGKTILLVEDEKYIRDIAMEILTNSGFTIIPAANGEEALKKYHLNKKAIALVVMDLLMPKMSGIRCAETLLRIKPDLDIILTTGSLAYQRVTQKESANVRKILHKPYTRDELIQTIETVMNQTNPNQG